MESIDKNEFFKQYKVYDYQNDICCGIITGVEVSSSRKISDNDVSPVNLTIHLLVDINNKAAKRTKTFKRIYHTGRNTFQEFANCFSLFTTDDDNNSIVELNKLLGEYCTITLNSKKAIESIEPAIWADEESKQNCKSFFKDVQIDKEIVLNENVFSDSEYFINNGNMPYTFIPFHGPDSAELLSYADYTGYIYDVECDKDNFNPNDVAICIFVYVFNGGYISKKRKCFNQVKSSGKREFGKFCNELSLINSNGTISPDDITGKFCCIRLHPDGKYINEIALKNINGAADKKQYTDIIQRIESTNKKKGQNINFENSVKQIKPLRKTGSGLRKNMK